jgi:hypothetical protein
MGAIMKDEFDIEFIHRTKQIIEGYKGQYNVTLLLNCLLGLIVLPSEFYKRKRYSFFDKDVTEYPELADLTNGMFFVPTKNSGRNWVPDKTTLKNLIKKIRNGISHQQIEANGTGEKWQRVVIRDFNIYNNNNLELEIDWSVKNLTNFALFIADQYTVEIKRISAKTKLSQSTRH